MKDNITPEEKLLNLIKKDAKPAPDEKKKNEDGRDPNAKFNTEANQAKGQGDVKREIEKSSQLPQKKGHSGGIKSQRAIPRKMGQGGIKFNSYLNKLLFMVFFCAIAYMIYAYIYAYKSEYQILEKIKDSGISGITERAPKESPSFSHYTDVLGKRQMFRIYEVPKPKPSGPPKPKISLQQILGGYTFIGIVFGDVPQAIVEERRTGQSFYLTAGQFLGEIKIEKIESGKITVSYEDETMDIRI